MVKIYKNRIKRTSGKGILDIDYRRSMFTI